ncbi:hypothetical protein AOC10_01720 [Polynucleobacter asymbioticus]|uniref:Gfo/Idh/MocA family protein n=1 Tax=Polynucleobacter asymbioticus TaxID=576611 RepID=UPI0008FAFC29|nr:Gfo/Idh/MocA family oxidoreductase [Polynucleobacter asymbioticus]APC05335.1 hypothetical protein AOC10_01720 [Polynucleobacter asymbioticus]
MSLYKPRVLFIGCGNIAGRFDMARPVDELPITQAGAFQRHGGFELAACVDPDEQARLTFAAHWKIPYQADSIQSLQVTCGEFDVIGLCSPTVLHHIHLEAALALRPRVIFCEKPLTQSLSESSRWEQECALQGVSLVVNYTRQWDPSVAQLIEEVQAGRWGSVRSVVGYYNKGIFNNGGHLIDLLLRLLGPLEVIAAGTPVHDYSNSDPTVSGLLQSVRERIPICLAPANAKDYALFELELVCELGLVRMLNGGMQWETRIAEVSPHFSGYHTLVEAQIYEGHYKQAMTLAVTEIYDHLMCGAITRSTGGHALAIQAICEELLAVATHTTPSIN